MRITVNHCLLFTFALCVIPAGVRAQDISVKAVQTSEVRQQRLDDSKKRVSPGYLSVTLQFKGDAVRKLTRIGNWQITAAKDDKGTDLANRSRFRSKTLFRTSRSFSAFSKKAPRLDVYESSYTLKLPSRAASKVTAFQGSVQLSLSDLDTVSIPVSKLAELKGKQIDDPALKKAGLTVTLSSVSQSSNSISVGVKFTGSDAARDKFLRLRFEDKSGKILSESNTYSGFKQGSGSIYTFGKLGTDGTLKLDVETKRQDVTVKFDLKDIPLP